MAKQPPNIQEDLTIYNNLRDIFIDKSRLECPDYFQLLQDILSRLLLSHHAGLRQKKICPAINYPVIRGHDEKVGIRAAFGCTPGIVPHMAAGVLGLAALLHACAVAFEIVRYLGAVWLLYMAKGMCHGTGAMKIAANESTIGVLKIISNGILRNLLNPKLSLFFLAFRPQFVSANTPDTTGEMTIPGLIFMVMTFGAFAIYGCFAGALRSHVIERPNVMRWPGKGFSAAFIAMGAKLMTDGR